ncbi:MAG: carbohydrate porin [Acetobacteraceae bacterium]
MTQRRLPRTRLGGMTMLALVASAPGWAQPAPTPTASPSAEPVQGPSEGNSPGTAAVRAASPSGATNAGDNAAATEQPYANRALGDMGGLRSQLAAYGVSLGLTEQSEALGNVTGGLRRGAVYEGVTSLGLGLDTEKAFGLAGGTVNLTAFHFHGRGLTNSNVPALTALTGAEQTVRGLKLFELWYEQVLLDKTLAIRVGQMSADQEFIITQYGGLFLNSGYGFPTLAAVDLPSGGPAYPLATPGVRVKIVPNESLAVLVGVFNGDPAGRGLGDPQRRDRNGTAFRLGDGTFTIAEVQYGINQGDTAPGLAGTYKLGAWYDSQPFADQHLSATGLSLASPANTAPARSRRNNYSVYAVADQLVWKKPGTTDGGVAVFARVMGAPADRNLVDVFAQGGVTYKAPFVGRENDTVGVAASWAHIGRNAAKLDADAIAYSGAYSGRAGLIRRSETQLELSYQAQITPWFQLQPDLQYVLNPGGTIANPSTGKRVGDALVLDLRAAMTF